MIMKQKIKKRRKEKPARVQALGALRCCFYPSEKKNHFRQVQITGEWLMRNRKGSPFFSRAWIKKKQILTYNSIYK